MSGAKRAQFQHVAPRRARKVLDALRVLRKCADTETYSYNDYERDRILLRIDKAVAELRGDFIRGGAKRFSLRVNADEEEAPERSPEPPSAQG